MTEELKNGSDVNYALDIKHFWEAGRIRFLYLTPEEKKYSLLSKWAMEAIQEDSSSTQSSQTVSIHSSQAFCSHQVSTHSSVTSIGSMAAIELDEEKQIC